MSTSLSPDELHSRVRSGCLSSLKELRMSNYPYQNVDIVWPHLQILGTYRLSEVMLSQIADTVDEGKFPALCSVCVENFMPEAAPLHKFSAFKRLTKAKILCHERVVKDHNFSELRCPCQSTFQI